MQKNTKMEQNPQNFSETQTQTFKPIFQNFKFSLLQNKANAFQWNFFSEDILIQRVKIVHNFY